MEKKIVVTQSDYMLILNFIKNNAKILSPYTFSRLSEELAQAKVVAEDKHPKGIIKLNSEVELWENTLKMPIKIKFVIPSVADAKQNRISIFSPLGIALIGYQEGDLVEWELHGIMRQYQVLKVTNA